MNCTRQCLNYCSIFYYKEGFSVHMSWTNVYAGMKFCFSLIVDGSIVYYLSIMNVEMWVRNERSYCSFCALWLEWNMLMVGIFK